jgi:methyl-accepting chemotaxis protein
VSILKAEESPLARVVAVHEGAKAILNDSHHINLRALDATVRSIRGGAQLRGFAEVSAQMRQWSQELHAAVTQVTKLSAEQVNVVSAFEKRVRMIHLLSAACNEPAAARLLSGRLDQARAEGRQIELSLREVGRKVRTLLEDLQQLGLMACVLSTSALIEAATAGTESKDLTIVSRDFADRSQKVTENIRVMLASDRQVSQ